MDVCHLSPLCELQKRGVWLRAGARCVAVHLDIFRATPAPRPLVFASRAFSNRRETDAL